MLAMTLLCGIGCERATVRGIVIDERDARLPGVAVTVEGARDQALTNAVGEYTIQFRPRGQHVLQFRKSGFTPGILELEVSGPRTVQARTIELWRVPPNAGVFILEDFEFQPTTLVEVGSYPIVDLGLRQGTQRDPEFVTLNQEPIILLYRLPLFGVSLARLHEQPKAPDPAAPVSAKAITNAPMVWILGEPLAADLVAVDQPQGVLHHLQYDSILEPGVYAVHWGGLHGPGSPEPRVFVFRISTPEEADAEEVMETPASEATAPENPTADDGDEPAPEPGETSQG